MALAIKRSTDLGAPTLTDAEGSLIEVLDWAFAGSGWTKVFSGTNKAVYRPGSAARGRRYYRVADDGTTSCPNEGRRCARITAYCSMSGVDTGTEPFGWDGVSQTYSVWPYKSATTDGTARPYIIARDARTAIILLANGQYGPPQYPLCYSPTYLGEFFSYREDDEYQECIVGRLDERGDGVNKDISVDNYAGASYWYEGGSAYEKTGIYVCRDFDGFPGGLSGQLPPHPLQTPEGNNSGKAHLACDGMNGVNEADGRLWMTWRSLTTKRTANALRGRLRGHMVPLTVGTYLAGGDIIHGTGELAGKTFEAVKLQIGLNSGGINLDFAPMLLETSDTWEAS
jgi:hypothetical protein